MSLRDCIVTQFRRIGFRRVYQLYNLPYLIRCAHLDITNVWIKIMRNKYMTSVFSQIKFDGLFYALHQQLELSKCQHSHEHKQTVH